MVAYIKQKVGQPRKFKSAKELQEKIDQYFVACDETKKPYTITGLALALDTNRQTLINYQSVEGFEEYVDTIKKAKLRVESFAENHLYSGQQVAGVIFNLKNNFGWKDKQEHELTGPAGGPIEISQLTPEERQARIDELIRKRGGNGQL